jgi:hypothetical protein
VSTTCGAFISSGVATDTGRTHRQATFRERSLLVAEVR